MYTTKTHPATRTSVAAVVIAGHAAVIYALAVTMGVVEAPPIIEPIKAVIIDTPPPEPEPYVQPETPAAPQQPVVEAKATASKAALPAFKQYRDTDGRFYFKLTDAEGNVLVQSNGFDSPKDAGKLIGVLKQAEQADAMETPEIVLQVPAGDVLAALAALRAAEA